MHSVATRIKCGGIFNYCFAEKLLLSQALKNLDKNSSGDEIANVNFYAVRQEATRIR